MADADPILMALTRRADLVEAIDSTGMGQKSGVLRFDFRPGEIEITGTGASTTIDAECVEEISLHVDAAALKRIAPLLPADENIMLRVYAQTILIGTTRFPITAVTRHAPRPIMVPLNGDFSHVIAMIASKGEADVVATLGQGAVDAAQYRFKRVIENAYRNLSAFGITREQIKDFALKSLAQRR